MIGKRQMLLCLIVLLFSLGLTMGCGKKEEPAVKVAPTAQVDKDQQQAIQKEQESSRR